MADRQALANAFLEETDWAGCERTALPADASTRSYARLRGGPSPALLMNAPPAEESAACPPDATPEERAALGYNAEARLAGPSLSAFMDVARWLRERGVHAPEVFAADREHGFAVIEDMGDRLLAVEAADPAAERAHYARSIKVLHALRDTGAEPGPIGAWTLQTYDETALLAEARLLPEWYVPYATGEALLDGADEAYENAWREVLSQLGPCDTLVLRDFHAENILVLGEGVGVIDFQDALVGSAAYDLASLIEDARRDLAPGHAQALYQGYVERLSKGDRERFETDYAILAAQRNAKILGIFARLQVRDGKPRYGAFVPRVRAHFQTDLARAPLAPVRAWAERYLPEVVRG
ncbi:aminoglycoside phosphotransferase family protein [Parvularcula dongshanensis]|uniref:Aminoglycoside phosphotransferase domain-containing protein n=1 Tax=Parvularcula dongshanensis TaxID=1173995 RepID=A0A840HYQ2_9PROT|nr:phosphotransferase [Parvularcula dongshanensis]MBB4657567.1 hypothetical protein [Parvularcula dongshanensis]